MNEIETLKISLQIATGRLSVADIELQNLRIQLEALTVECPSCFGVGLSMAGASTSLPCDDCEGVGRICKCHRSEDVALIVAAMKAQAIIADRDRRLAEFRKLAQDMPHLEGCLILRPVTIANCREPKDKPCFWVDMKCAAHEKCTCGRAKFLAITGGGE